ncbi:MBL fold metallo-hydrolase [Haloplanus rubicundus]|uniref:MBL fold metallo-hydrolase n=1 Tax=Haloplanus rubicundus TaxID=1547898 RepID=A0A345EF20_9EURY|nr:MBL fold metallo-hydrolase [Haloplanus rubicundus]AXG10792.1 MBL fold metallo-hydrolase [Haloplanus rubicundus]
MTVRHDTLTVRWLGYATTRLSGPETTVYTDPGRYGVLTGEWQPPEGLDTRHPAGPAYDARDGDAVLVTHDHHYDPDGIRRVAAPDATLVVYEGVGAERAGRPPSPEALAANEGYDLIRIGERETVEAAGVTVRSLPAYNDPDGPHAKPDRSVVHPEGFGVGYRFVVDGVSVLWPGDSDVLPLHRDLDASLFLANVSGSVCMDRHEAAALAEALDPDLVCPIHYDTQSFLAADSRAFAADVAARGVPVVLDEGWD